MNERAHELRYTTSMCSNKFANILVHHPYFILIVVALFSGASLIIPFTSKTFPHFSDPQTGYQTRGTPIANKLTAWHNLNEELTASGHLTVNPKEYLSRSNISITTYKPKKNRNLKRKKKNRNKHNELTELTVKEEDFNSTIVEPIKILNESQKTTNKSVWLQLKNLVDGGQIKESRKTVWSQLALLNDVADRFFCGIPSREYGHVVLESNSGEDLFTMPSLQTICRIEHELIETPHYKDFCIKTSKNTKCCRPWSLPNYIALINHRTSCLAITEQDIQATKEHLQNCSYYYHNAKLTGDCGHSDICNIPQECMKYNAVFNILNFITSMSFLPPNKTNDVILKETMIFLPLARSGLILPYFEHLKMAQLSYDGIAVVGINFGIKNALFDETVLKDTWLLGLGGLFVLICMWLYTGSLFLTIMTIIAIVFSLSISYLTYTDILKLRFFPFMNLLTAIVVMGIGADDAFIFSKVWQIMKHNNSGESMSKIMACTLQHALLSMIVTSFTTAAAFSASFISAITAIKCFSVFASIAVITNCLLMIVWFPACIIVWEQIPPLQSSPMRGFIPGFVVRWCCFPRWSSALSCTPSCFNFSGFFQTHEHFIPDMVVRFRHYWFTLLTCIAFGSGIVVLYYPKLELPNRSDLQLFQSSNLLERYDMYYKHHFWFHNNDPDMNLPMRFVWGILSSDNGNHMEPEQFGTLEYDKAFNMSHPESQKWLMDFCRDLKKQPFYLPDDGIILPNCFIEPFKRWMERPCEDDMEGINHSPCCETERFPYRSWVFEKCIINAMADLYATPSTLFIRGAAGPKFSKGQNATIKAIVIEFSSNYTYTLSFEYMSNFIRDVEAWFDKIILTAPTTIRGGWFVSELDFYDLQQTLSNDTIIGILLSMGLALTVILLVTLNLLTSLFVVINITCTIFVTMAVLVLLGWKLNILESIAMSTTIGLSVDFALHYAVNYTLSAPEIGNRMFVTRHILTKMLKPVSMAALTTAAVGAFMIPSTILAYTQIGTFLVIVMCISWLYSTFHFGSLLAIAGPEHNFGQCTYAQLFCHLCKSKSKKIITRNQSATSSISESHELNLLTSSGPASSVSGVQKNSGQFVLSDQSLTATSTITVIMHDDT